VTTDTARRDAGELTQQGCLIGAMSDIGGQRTSRIGRDVIASALPNALIFELAKGD